MSLQKTIATGALYIAGLATVLPAFGQAAVLNADGFKENPRCSTPAIIQKTVAKEGNIPSGIKAESERFSLEIYHLVLPNNSASFTNWTLVGEKKEGTDKGKLCLLASSVIGNDYRKEPWYGRYFTTQSATASQIAPTPKP